MLERPVDGPNRLGCQTYPIGLGNFLEPESLRKNLHSLVAGTVIDDNYFELGIPELQ